MSIVEGQREITERVLNRSRLIQLLRLRKDQRYRSGLLQGAVLFGVISQAEWIDLTKQIQAFEKEPILRKGWRDEKAQPKCCGLREKGSKKA